MEKIEAVVFDLGGVLYDIDYAKTQKALSAFSTGKIEYSLTAQHPIFSVYESGLCSSDEFRNSLRKEYALACTDSEFDIAWNALLINLIEGRAELVRSVSAGYTTALLSNTNEIHFTAIEQECAELLGEFHHVFLSYAMGTRKPEHDIYKNVERSLQVQPESILFLDDSPLNCAAARECGWNVVHIESHKDVENVVRTLLAI